MRLLVVEDEPKMAALVRRGLADEGHAADVAGAGEDAVWMAEGHPYDGSGGGADVWLALPAGSMR